MFIMKAKQALAHYLWTFKVQSRIKLQRFLHMMGFYPLNLRVVQNDTKNVLRLVLCDV